MPATAGAKTGIQQELNVSSELAAIIGTAPGEKISRPQVCVPHRIHSLLYFTNFVYVQCVKRLWAYLKEKDLQDPANKQWFTPDDTMAPIFGNEKIKAFSMSKYLKQHLTNENTKD